MQYTVNHHQYMLLIDTKSPYLNMQDNKDTYGTVL